MANLVTSTARVAVLVGLIVCGLLMALWVFTSGIDRLGLASFVARFVHVLAGMVWVGMIWFVNFIQLGAIEDADEVARPALLQLVALRVAWMFRMASHVSLASGVVLLLTSGYLFDRWIFSSVVYASPMKAAFLWGGTLAALVMWVFVHMIIWPNLKVLASASSDAGARMKARSRVRTFARLNLVLAVPVTFVMVGAAHLY